MLEEATTSERCLLLRFGCVFPQENDDVYEVSNILSDMVAALNRDARVDNVRVPVDEPSAMSVRRAARVDKVGGDWSEEKYLGFREWPSPMLPLDNAIAFEISIPLKNQYPEGTTDDEKKFYPEPVSSKYHVRWDGFVFTVAWEQSTDDSPFRHGGTIVREVLREIVADAGLEPGSQYPTISHEAIRLLTESSLESPIAVEVPDGNGLIWDQFMPEPFDVERYLDFAFSFSQYSAHLLYGVTAARNRFMDAVRVRNSDLTDLLKLQTMKSGTESGGFRDAIKRRWALRHWRSKTRRLIARIWYAATMAGEAQMSIRDGLSALREESKQCELEFFKMAAKDVDEETNKFEAPPYEVVIESVSRSTDSRDLVLATIIASAIGVVIGAAVVH